MVVDPDAESLASLFKEAQDRGLSVITADTPEVALASFEHARPDLVLTDLFGAERPGLALAQQIRDRHRLCPVIVLTDQGGEDAVLAALKVGVADYLSKPVSPKDLWEAVDRALAALPQSPATTPGVERIEHLLVCDLEPAQVGGVVQALLSAVGLPIPEPQLGHLRASLHELLINAVEHGTLEITFRAKQDALSNDTYERLVAERRRQPKHRDRRVRIRAVADRVKKLLEFRITDEGKGFGWKTLLRRDRDPLGSGYGCGRGLHVTKAFFPDLTYNDAGTEAVLRLALP